VHECVRAHEIECVCECCVRECVCVSVVYISTAVESVSVVYISTAVESVSVVCVSVCVCVCVCMCVLCTSVQKLKV
jgi:hypothetical protein